MLNEMQVKCIYIYIYKYKVICLEKINGFYFKNTSTMLILSAMNYTKMNMVEKPNVAIIIITMLEILSKKMAHIESVGNSYTY
jgi:hypothetical protein